LAFSKKRADDRKLWIGEYTNQSIDHDTDTIEYSEFVHKELVLFSRADVVRSIPNVMDGLKPGQRKVLFAACKRRLTSDIKVAQFSGYVAEHSAYHHGEMSLASTIVGMAQEYVGSNTINLLVPSGQFGTRIMGGHDAASARYIYTRLDDITRYIYMKDDDPLVSYIVEEGQTIEPEWYVPILPMILVNGASGIGTGWSTFIPSYNPRDIIENIKRYIDGVPMNDMIPWYRGFKGRITQTPTGFETHGIYTINGTRIRITELPIGRWTQHAKDYYISMMDPGHPSGVRVRHVTDNSTDTDVCIEIDVSREDLARSKQKGIETVFKLTTKVSTTNMVAFDPSGKIRRYSSPLDMITEYAPVRLDFYSKRLQFLLDTVKRDMHNANAKMQFMEAVMDDRLHVFRVPKHDILERMTQLNLPMIDDTYEPMLRMHIQSFTREHIDELKRDIETMQSRIMELEHTMPQDMWLNDLDSLQEKLDTHLA